MRRRLSASPSAVASSAAAPDQATNNTNTRVRQPMAADGDVSETSVPVHGSASRDADQKSRVDVSVDAAAITPPSLHGEWGNLLLLTGLYTLQGIPMGLASSIPLFLQARGAGFRDQATFGLSSWPYSLKLLWAPVVDALYTRRFGLGLRKSWIVPVQFVTGAIMLILGSRIDAVFGGAPEAAAATTSVPHIDVWGLTASFFVLYFLVATQDIAVDGWALTMLRPENVGYASTANTVGQTFGIMLAYGLLIALDSATFCNAYVRAPLGLPPLEAGFVTMSGFMQFWGVVFILCTVLLWMLKTEEAPACSPGDMIAAHAGAPADGVLTESSRETSGGTLPMVFALRARRSSEDGGGGAIASDLDAADFDDRRRSGSRTASKKHTNGNGGSGGGASLHAVAVDDSDASTLREYPLDDVTSDSDSGRVGRSSRRPSRSGGSISGRVLTPPRRGGMRRRTPPAGSSDESSGSGGDGSGHSTSTSAPGSSGGGGSDGEPVVYITSTGAIAAAVHSNDGNDDEEEERVTLLDSAAADAAPSRPPKGPLRNITTSSASTATTNSLASDAIADAAPPPSTLVSVGRALASAYRDLYRVACLPSVLSLVFILFTAKAGFSVTDGATSIMIQARGVPKETIALLDVISTPLQLSMQLALSRITARPNPLSLFMAAYPVRIVCGIAYLGVIYGLLGGGGGSVDGPSTATIAVVFLLSNVHALVQSIMFISQISFFTRVSDPSMGGTYMTLLNTVSNLGVMWPRWLALNSIDWVTQKQCILRNGTAASDLTQTLSCASADAASACASLGSDYECVTTRDGYLVMVLISSVVSLVWWLVLRRSVLRLEAAPRSAWLPSIS